MGSTGPNARRSILAALLALALLGAGCGGDDGGDPLGASLDGTGEGETGDDGASTEDIDEFADAINEAQGAGGGGSLTFDGTEYAIESAVCLLESDYVDVGTVGEDFRVFVTGEPPDDLSPQILDPDAIQWFDGDPADAASGDLVTLDGSTLEAPTNTWWNNQDDRVIEASFVIECP